MIALHITKNMQLYERTLGQWLEHWAETTPDKEYIVYSDRNLRFTWKQFNKRVDDMAKGLIAIGVERGTHVGIWAANVPDPVNMTPPSTMNVLMRRTAISSSHLLWGKES